MDGSIDNDVWVIDCDERILNGRIDHGDGVWDWITALTGFPEFISMGLSNRWV